MPGRWQPPPSTARVRNQQGSQSTSEGRGQLPLTPGIRRLRQLIVARWPIQQTYMPGRTRRGPHRRDVHEEGRAVDIMVNRLPAGVERYATGDRVANWVVRNAQALGIQLVIWNGTMWSASNARAPRVTSLPVSSHQHTDHPHLEISPDSPLHRAGYAPRLVDDPGAWRVLGEENLSGLEGAPLDATDPSDLPGAQVLVEEDPIGRLPLVGALVGSSLLVLAAVEAGRRAQADKLRRQRLGQAHVEVA